MSIAAKETFLRENPHIVQEIFHSPIPQGDSIRLGLRKPDDGFRDILREVKKHHPTRGKETSLNTW